MEDLASKCVSQSFTAGCLIRCGFAGDASNGIPEQRPTVSQTSYRWIIVRQTEEWKVLQVVFSEGSKTLLSLSRRGFVRPCEDSRGRTSGCWERRPR